MKQKGFTLIELLISITLVSVVLVIIMGGLRLSINAWEAGEERIEISQRMRSVLQRVSHDIESTFLFYYKKNTLKNIKYLAFKGDKQSFSIISSTKGIDRDPIKGAGLREITYFSEDDPNESDKKNLRRRERFVHPDFLFKERDSLVANLIYDLAWVKFRYFKVALTTEGKERPLGWSETFGEVTEFEEDQGINKIRKKLPRAIEITIALYEKKGDERVKTLLPPLIIPIKTGQEITKEILPL